MFSFEMADVMPFVVWADVITLADVIAIWTVADVVAICYCGRCYYHWGRCYILYYSKVADVIAIWCCGRC